MLRKTKLPISLWTICGVLAITAGARMTQTNDLGIFTNESSVGQTPPGCKVHYDSASGAYRITGGGENMWNAADAFYFIWKKASGDLTLTADVQFTGTSSAEHRKAVLMVRQSLDPGSAYADAAFHGNGLTSLQFRGSAGENTYQVFTEVDQPARIRIVRQRSRFTMYAGKPNAELKPVGPIEFVSLKDPVYVGLGVCSHVATTLETAVFSNVSLQSASMAKEASGAKRPPIVGVAHIALKTNDMAGAQKFYGLTLGFADITSTSFKVNDHQYIEVSPDLKTETEDRLSHVAFETTDARQLRDYLASRDVRVPEAVQADPDGDLSFTIKDPNGHDVEFVQYMPDSIHSRNFGKLLPDSRISKRIIHVGFTVQDRAADDALFKDILGFQVMWYGGKKDNEIDWVDMRVPEGSDWLEYMLNVHNPSPRTLGVMHHLALGVPNVQNAYRTILDRGLTPPQPPKVGADGKWQLNLYDPNLTRAELMEFEPVQTPCCSPMLKPPVIVKQ
jgi:catechol 2,3-dioxygenase-like lactoylglutathione lyase family enzyme